MECDRINERLQAYLEGILGREELAAVEEHLGRCESCAKNLEELRLTIRLVKDLDEVEPPPWMTQKIMAAVRAEAPPTRGILERLFKPLYVKLPIEALAVVLLGVATYYVFKAVEPEMRPVAPPPQEMSTAEKASPLQQAQVKEEGTSSAGKSKQEAAGPPRPGADREPDALGAKGGGKPGALPEERPPAEPLKAAPPAADLQQPPAPAGPFVRKDKDLLSVSREEERVSEGVRRQESAATPAPAAPVAGSADHELRQKAPKLEMVSKAQAVSAVSVYAQDTERTAALVEEAVKHLQGAVTRKEDIQGGVALHVRLDSGRFDDLLTRLREIGRTREGPKAQAVRDGASEFTVAVLKESAR